MNTLRTLLLVCLLPALAWAGSDSIDAVKARMAERQPAINAMKVAQGVGENNQGLLEVLQKDQADKSMVKAENKDRKKVYKAIAKETDTNADDVGRLRARQIAERSASGVMIQDVQGNWAAKP